jgi:hypothetical protein
MALSISASLSLNIQSLLGDFQYKTLTGPGIHRANYIREPSMIGVNPSSINGKYLEMFPNSVYANSSLSNEMRYFNYQMFHEFVPDVNGYTLSFLIPPTFNSFPIKDDSFMNYFQKLTCFAIYDVVPATEQVTSDRISNRSGGISFPIDVTPSEQITITYCDNYNMDIFNFHHYWVLYMKEIMEGFHSAPKAYLNYDNDEYGALDYVGAAFIVKYDPSMTMVKYVGKAVGIYPTMMPNRETVGTRVTNELVMLPITYQCPWCATRLQTN